jgi:transcriptional regulator with XRE-family HTH domain
MTATFGSRLRAQRERQQLTLPAIAASMKVRVSLLDQLENDRLDLWPKGIFGRSYLREYARNIGLDPEAVVREFSELQPPAEYHPFAAAEQAAQAAETEATHRGERLRRLVSAAFLGVPRPVYRDQPALPGLQQRRTAPPTSHVEPPAVADEPPPAPAEPVAQEAVTNGNGHPAGERRHGRDRRQVNLSVAADLSARLARALDWADVTALLADAARLVDAVGVVVWLWDARTSALRASAAHGYAPEVLASLPEVRPEDANAIAAAFRSGEACTVNGEDGTTGAVVVPSVGPAGCVGVLALEVRSGCERHETVRALATILAAQLGGLVPPVAAGDAEASPA